MACITDHYRSAIEQALGWAGEGFDALTLSLGKPLAIVATVVLMAPTALLLAVVTQILVPKFFKWYFDKTINEKAIEYWDRKCRGTGMTVAGAKLSIALGVFFFFAARFVVALPMHYRIALPTFLAAFLAVAIVAYFFGGNPPKTTAGKSKYVRRFYTPTVTGVGLGVATIALEFLLEVATLTVRYVHTL